MPPDVQAFLTEFARTVQRLGMYPPGHPAVTAMVESTREHLNNCLSARPSLTIRIDRDHLRVDDTETDPEQVLSRSLARRLYRHLLYNLSFKRGLEADELIGFLSAVSVVPGPKAEPIGATEPDPKSRWPHIGIELIPFESFALAR